MVVARGGRYDELVLRCGARPGEDFGAGFSLAIDPIRELLMKSIHQLSLANVDGGVSSAINPGGSGWNGNASGINRAVLPSIELHPFNDRSQAEQQANDQGGFQLDWIDP